jgi:hypothetical protein
MAASPLAEGALKAPKPPALGRLAPAGGDPSRDIWRGGGVIPEAGRCCCCGGGGCSCLSCSCSLAAANLPAGCVCSSSGLDIDAAPLGGAGEHAGLPPLLSFARKGFASISPLGVVLACLPPPPLPLPLPPAPRSDLAVSHPGEAAPPVPPPPAAALAGRLPRRALSGRASLGLRVWRGDAPRCCCCCSCSRCCSCCCAAAAADAAARAAASAAHRCSTTIGSASSRWPSGVSRSGSRAAAQAARSHSKRPACHASSAPSWGAQKSGTPASSQRASSPERAAAAAAAALFSQGMDTMERFITCHAPAVCARRRRPGPSVRRGSRVGRGWLEGTWWLRHLVALQVCDAASMHIRAPGLQGCGQPPGQNAHRLGSPSATLAAASHRPSQLRPIRF